MSDTVVLVHGFATSALRTWQETGWVDLLGDIGKQVLTPDLAGHGTSAKSHDPADYALVTEQLLENLPSHPVDMVGFSQGARLTLEIASNHPERVNRIVVAGVGENVLRPSALGADLADILDGTSEATTPLTRHFAQLADAPDQDALALAAFLRGMQSKALTPHDLSSITAPVLVVLGTEDFAGPAQPLVDAIPGATLVELPGVDHFATPKAFGFIDAALDFLASPAPTTA